MATLRLVPASGEPIDVAKDQVMVGRDPSCDIVLGDGSVSRKHARIEKRGEVFAVVDQASANGTFLDSQRVADAGLRSGQEIRFGAVAFRVEIEGAPADMSATLSTPVASPSSTVIQPVPLAPPKPMSPPPPPPAAAPPRPAAPPPPRPAVAPPPPPRPAPPAAPRAMGSPVPPMAGGAPPKKGKGPVFWIATGCCGCLTLCVIVVALIFGAAMLGTQGAVSAVREQLAEIKQGQLDRAYAGMSESYRSQTSAREFQRLVAAHPALKENADVTFMERSVDNNTARLTGFLSSTSGQREAVRYELVKEGGNWKISAITFPGQSSLGGGGPPDRS